MSGDYKWEMQLIAEEMAEKLYGVDFYDLPQREQFEIYNEATRQYTERLCDQADYLRKKMREEGQ